MRWYGPNDVLSLRDLKQVGIEGIVTSLHEVPVGEVWTKEAIAERKAQIEHEGLQWSVIESLPVHEDIKKRSGNYPKYLENYKQSLRNIGSCGIGVVTYNFMPVLDWVRTDHYFENPQGATVLRFDATKFAVFDLFYLKREGAREEYSPELIDSSQELNAQLSDDQKQDLIKSVLLGLPGSSEHFSLEQIRELLLGYSDISSEDLRNNLVEFLEEITPVAAQVNVNLALHPDDPPFPVLGLPRVVSTRDDLDFIFEKVDHLTNGLCFCTGSLGAHPANDLTAMFDLYKDRIHFLHLRNVVKDQQGNFMESDHLEGDVPMTSIVKKILQLQQDTRQRIPMRPDHGYLHSMERTKKYYPGYSFIGRLKGLAELRGLETGLLETLK